MFLSMYIYLFVCMSLCVSRCWYVSMCVSMCVCGHEDLGMYVYTVHAMYIIQSLYTLHVTMSV